MRIIVVNDIHSNSSALHGFCQVIEDLSFDKIVFLGDLLTYGVDVKETLNIIESLNSRYHCIFIKGNHDQIYFDAQSGQDYEYKPFPLFIKESVESNLNKLEANLESLFPWIDSYTEGGVYFAHANTYSYGDWSYLNTEEEFDSNIRNLDSLDCYVGIFGHTHRAKYKVLQTENRASARIDLIAGGEAVTISSKHRAVVTNGSLGQPRNSSSSFLICDIKNDEIEITSLPVDYDAEPHKQNIINSNLSLETKEKLLSYYK